MKTSTTEAMADIVLRHAPGENFNPTGIPGVTCIRIDDAGEKLPEIYNPCICLVVQGAKAITYGNEILNCNAGDYMTIPVTTPIIGTVTEASKAAPYLCLQVSIDLTMAGEIFLSGTFPAPSSKLVARSLFVETMEEDLGEPLLRLAGLLDHQEDAKFLAPLYTKEVCYRLLHSAQGRHIAHLAMHEGNLQKIGKVISHINRHYKEAIRIGDLADIAEMSISGMHQRFKEITTLTPIQFQKQLRLIEAKRYMVAEQKSASEAAFHVGYESPSQFSREYARMFGKPPGKDSAKHKSSA